MKHLVLAAALLALAIPAQAQTSRPAGSGNTAAASSATKTFVHNAAMTDMFEIQSGQLAEQKATTDGYKDFAQMIVQDHTKTGDQLKGMTGSMQGVTLPTELDAAHKAKMDKLTSLSGTQFDRQFKTDQVQGHEQAVRMFENYAKTGDNSDLKKWAQDTLPTLRTHLQHAEALPKAGPAATVGSGSSRTRH